MLELQYYYQAKKKKKKKQANNTPAVYDNHSNSDIKAPQDKYLKHK